VISVSSSILSTWNRTFDENMVPLTIPDNRGKASKVTIETVRRVCDKAKAFLEQGKRIRLKQFTETLNKEDAIAMSATTINEILIANDLASAQIRKKRPKFYQSLCRRIPNGLLSFDGSEFTVLIDDQPFKFNVELAVDVTSFNHTAFSIADTETTDEVIKTLEEHCRKWGCPVGILCDHGTANLSDDAQVHIKGKGIELVPTGPGNPKGNGTDEGAFSQMKKALGSIRIEGSSPRALAESILHALISVYIYMRNRLTLRNGKGLPIEQMAVPVSEDQRDFERERLKQHNLAKAGCNEDQNKLDRLGWIISHYGLELEPSVFKRAQYSIKAYDIEAIAETEQVFLKAVKRKSDRCNLSYFFGILRNIQQKRDEEAKRRYCHQRYNYQTMQNLNQQKNDCKDPVSVDNIIAMIEKAVIHKSRFVKELSIRKAKQWIEDLMQNYTYAGSLKKKLSDALGKLTHLNLEQKQEVWSLLEDALST
jgi:hypothetical protein